MCAATTDVTQTPKRDPRDNGPISDADVAAVLRPFVRATRPLLGTLSDSDPFGLQARAQRATDGRAARVKRTLRTRVADRLASTRAPGTAAWKQMDMHARSNWWVRRVGRVTSLVAAIPGFGGAVTSKLPVSSGLGAVAQGLVLCAIADEHDMHDEVDVVALLGAVMFRRDLCPPARAELSRASDAAIDAPRRRADRRAGEREEAHPQAAGRGPVADGPRPAGHRGRAREAPARRPDHPLDLVDPGGRGGGQVPRRVVGPEEGGEGRRGVDPQPPRVAPACQATAFGRSPCRNAAFARHRLVSRGGTR